MKNLKYVCLVLVSFFLFACTDDIIETNEVDQTDNPVLSPRSCGMSNHMEDLLSDPAHREAREARLEKFEKYASKMAGLRTLCSDPVILPMAVHFQNVSNPDAACLIALAQSQIAILNNDYQGTNSDIGNWTNDAASLFPGIAHGEACIGFCLANKNHPSGYGLNDGDFAVTINQTSGDSNADWSGYLNIFVQPNTGVLGYSPLGGSGNGDGVVIDASAFGTGAGCGSIVPQAPYNLGRTLTHELGHYLLLDHIWGGGCGSDDDVSDTPDSNEPYYGCPSNGASSCGSTDMHMNYMDYVNDQCMYMFSGGQAGRMENYVSSNLSNLVNNTANVCDGEDGGGGDGDGNCVTPTDANATAITETSALVNWSDISGATDYRFQSRVQGTSNWTTVTVVPSQYQLNGLMESTAYEFRVRTNCSGTLTDWSAIGSFVTDNTDGGGGEECATPTNIQANVLSDDAVELSWDAMPDAIRYKIRYKVVGSSPWIRKNTTATSYSLTGLMPNTEYVYAVKTRCPGGWTAWSTNQQFTTMDDGGSGGDCAVVNFELVLDLFGSETTWELVNDYGDQIDAGGPYQDNAEGTVINESFCLEDGCYALFVDDSYGDGICCDYGEGYFQLLDESNSVIAYSDGYFGYYDVLDICVEGGEVNLTGNRKDAKSPNLAKKIVSSN